jgi:gas vesicle protein
MEKELLNLRNRMIKEKFHNVSFSDKRKQMVLYEIRKKKNSIAKIPGSILKSFVSGVVSLGLITGLLVYGIEQMQQKEGNIPIKSGETNPTENDKTEAIKDPQQEQNYDPIVYPDHLTKDEVKSLMLHSNEYFKTATGSFTYKDPQSHYTVEYSVLLDEENYGAYSKIINSNNDIQEITVAHKDNIAMIYPIQKEYMSSKMLPYQGNDRPFGGREFHTLYHFEIANNYLQEDERWEIVEQTSTMLGHKVIVLGGSFNTYNATKHNAETFKLWVHKGTGIIMKMETYNSKREVIESQTTNELILNQPVDTSKFTIDIPKEYKNKLEQLKEEIDPREKDVKHIASAKTQQGNVDQVLEEIKEKVPFLIEFNNPNLKLVSDSLEQYKEYYTASLYYSVVNTSGISNIIGVRAYPKASFVRKGGIFDTEDKKELTPYSLNGFNWKVYSSEDGNRVTFICEKDDIIYEVGTQYMTVKEVKQYLQSFTK